MWDLFWVAALKNLINLLTFSFDDLTRETKMLKRFESFCPVPSWFVFYRTFMAWDLFPRLFVCYFSLLSSSLAVCSASWGLKIILPIIAVQWWVLDEHLISIIIISVQWSPHPENHCIACDSIVDQNISLPTLSMNIWGTIIIWLTFTSIWGIVNKLDKYLDKFCLIDLKK